MRLGRQAEQIMRFDQFEALVHQRRGIDRDFGAHRPIGMGNGLRGRRSARSRSAVAVRNGPPLAVRIILETSDRCDCRQGTEKSHYARCRPEAASRPILPAASVIRSPAVTSASLLARATVLPASTAAIVGLKSGAADDRGHDQVRFARGGLDQCVGAGCCTAFACPAEPASSSDRRASSAMTASLALVRRAASASASTFTDGSQRDDLEFVAATARSGRASICRPSRWHRGWIFPSRQSCHLRCER